MNKQTATDNRCQHEKLDCWDDPDVDVISIYNEDGSKRIAINACKKCKLLYAEVPDESR